MSISVPSLHRFVIDLRFINLFLGLLWLLLFRYAYTNSYYDPSSVFYRPEDAYTPTYSAVREQEADGFLSTITSSPTRARRQGDDNVETFHSPTPFCIGVPTFQRERNDFLPRTVASLVDRLSPEDRELIHIVVLLSDNDATTNSAFGQHWLNSIADTVLVHEDTPDLLITENHYEKIPRLSPDAPRDERVRRDYAMLSQTCRQRDAEFFILIEDDVIASRDWFVRLKAAIPKVNDRTAAKSRDWLYLRLFYSETYMGWNSEEWPMYIFNIVLIYMAVSGILFVVRLVNDKRPFIAKERKGTLSRALPANLLLIWLPLFILLAFMSGRLTVSPLKHGVQEMPQYGCCSQGLVIPQRHQILLEAKLKERPFNFPADSTIERAADTEGLEKWAIIPSVLQHTGIRGTSAQGGARKSTWNFSFERFYS